jgi:hypothetical protein
MVKKTVITLIILIILSTIISFNSGVSSTADECNDCTPIPSTSGDTDYCSINQNNPESKPVIQASSDQIGAGGTISLHIKTGSLSQPPYSWSVSSAKYTLNKNTTLSNPETVTMTAASGTCSSGYSDSNIYVTVTVTDNCGITSQAIIRNTAGSWQSYVTDCTGSYFENGDNLDEIIINQYKYILRYIGGNTADVGSSCDGSEHFQYCNSSTQCNSYPFEEGFNQLWPEASCKKYMYYPRLKIWLECGLFKNSTYVATVTGASRQIWGCP